VATKRRDTGLSPIAISFGHLQYVGFAVDFSDVFVGVVEINLCRFR